MADFLSGASADHFAAVRAGLDRVGAAYEISPRLVRGLDYYTRTTFEFVADALDTAQNAVGGGGRYDGLVEELGGPPTPGIGFALGVDRILLACDAEGAFAAAPAPVEVFVVDTVGGQSAAVLCDRLRQAGLGVDRAFDGRSMKAQMKRADRSGATVADHRRPRRAGRGARSPFGTCVPAAASRRCPSPSWWPRSPSCWQAGTDDPGPAGELAALTVCVHCAAQFGMRAAPLGIGSVMLCVHRAANSGGSVGWHR